MSKVLVLFSGGLDSLLAAKILQEKDYQVTAVHFQNPFSKLTRTAVKKIAGQLELKIYFIKLSEDYLQLVAQPIHGYGKNMNPCLDCRAFLLKKAWQLAQRINAEKLATGEVIGQRPFSQRKQGIILIEKEAGLEGKILRPLAELGIRGRGRHQQLALAKKYQLKNFLTPAGGCLLTDPAFSQRLKEFLDRGSKLTLAIVELLKSGRHFWQDKNLIVIGRHEKENQKLAKLARQQSWWFGEVVDIPSPIAVVFRKTALEPASQLLVRYSDAQPGQEVNCHWQKNGQKKMLKSVEKTYDRSIKKFIEIQVLTSKVR